MRRRRIATLREKAIAGPPFLSGKKSIFKAPLASFSHEGGKFIIANILLFNTIASVLVKI
jgi:hypothetical protein